MKVGNYFTSYCIFKGLCKLEATSMTDVFLSFGHNALKYILIQSFFFEGEFFLNFED